MSTDLAWKRWGEKDPYFGVITDPKYRSGNLDAEAKKAFFASGQSHVHHVLTTSAKRLLRKEFHPSRVLDFGCGVGRLVVPFAERVPEVVGVDVSEGMLAEARRNCTERGLQNVTLVTSDDDLSLVAGNFELIHSSIVFQHIDVPRGRDFFKLLLQRLAPRGVAVLHVTYAKQIHAASWGQAPHSPAAQEGNVRLRRPRGLRDILQGTVPASAKADPGATAGTSADADPEMQMNIYNLNELLFMVQAVGCRSFYTEFTDHGGELGVMLYFQRP